MRLAIVCTHPIQYYSPWFRYLAKSGLELRVFYLWTFGIEPHLDRGFGHELKWDIPLLDGYEHQLVPNSAADPGTHHFWGLKNSALVRELLNYAPDAVLMLGYNFASLLAAVLAPRLWDMPFLLRGDSHLLHDSPSPYPSLSRGEGTKRQIRAFVRRLLFKRFAAFLYVGEANKGYFRAARVPESRLFFAPHAVDNDRFKAARLEAEALRPGRRDACGFDNDDVVFMFVGKLEKKKRPDLLLEALGRMRNPRVRLLFVGAGELDSVLRAQAEGDPRVRFLPFQNQSKMPSVYASGDVLVLPSQGPGESWGLCINEAMCLGKPVIVSSHVGCGPDLVRPGRNGVIFPAGDVEALAEAMDWFAQDRGRVESYGAQSSQIIRDYSYEAASRGLMEALAAVARK